MIPAYRITAGAMTADSSSLTASGLPVALRVELRQNQVNTAMIRLGLQPSDTVAVGDPVQIALGDEDGQENVFTGVVTEIQRQVGAYTILASSGLEALSRQRINKLYEERKAGDIVKDLLDAATLTAGTVEDGMSYPAYAAGADRNLMSHVLQLARRDGYVLYADQEDAIHYRAHPAGPTVKARYAANLLEYHAADAPANVVGVEVYGESPASLGEGDKAYAWLTKQEVKGSAGESQGNVLRMRDPSVRNEEAAGKAAENMLAGYSPRKRGQVTILGDCSAVLGGSLEIIDLPGDGPNASYHITQVRHQLDKRNGFITTIWWQEE